MKEKIVLLYVLFATVIWKCFFTNGARLSDNLFWYDFFVGESKLISAFIFFGIVPILIVKFVFREKLSDYGLQLGEIIRTVRSFCIALPFIIFIAVTAGNGDLFCDVYPFNVGLRRCNLSSELDTKIFVIHSIFYVGYYFGWEFMFRGFIQHGLTDKCGVGIAILVQTIISVMLHFGHPVQEIFGSICAGLVWGYLAYRSRSIISGFAQHTFLGIILDWKLIYR
jgi:membrane protease YdiL (CAAX protease family)